MALRKAASQVEAELLEFRRLHAVTEAWPAAERLLVCVGPSPLSGKVIRTTHRIAESLRAEWWAVAVETPEILGASSEARARVLEHLRLANALGAETRSLSGRTVAETVLEFARRNNVTMIVIGKPTHPRWKDRLKGSLVEDLIRGSAEIEVHVVTGEIEPQKYAPPVELRSGQALAVDAGWALLVTVVATLVAWLIRPFVTTTDQVMVYMVGVLLVAYRARFQAAVMTALMCVAAFDFFFIPPFHTFAVAHAQYLLTFAVMGGFGVLVSGLVWRVRAQARAASTRQETNARLFDVTRRLAAAEDVREIL